MTLTDLAEAVKEKPNCHFIVKGTECGIEILVSQNGEIIMHDEFAVVSSIELALSNSPLIREKIFYDI